MCSRQPEEGAGAAYVDAPEYLAEWQQWAAESVRRVQVPEDGSNLTETTLEPISAPEDT